MSEFLRKLVGRPRRLKLELGALGELYSNGFKGARALFVLSTGRVGSMTLAKILDLSGEVKGVHEPAPQMLSLVASAYQAHDHQLEEYSYWGALVEATRSEIVWQAHRMGQVYAETSNYMTFFSPSLAKFFPSSKFILLHRSPFAVIESGLARGWYKDNPMDFARIRPGSGNRYHSGWNDLTQAEKIAWNWNETYSFGLGFFNTLANERRMVLSSDDLFDRDRAESTVNDLFGFLGVPRPRMSRLNKVLSRQHNATKPGRKSDSARLTAAELDTIRLMVEETNARLGRDAE